MKNPWKEIVMRGVCHYPDVSDETLYIVTVDDFTPWYWQKQRELWRGKHGLHRGKTWYVVVFNEPSPASFPFYSSAPFATLEEATKFAEEKVPTGIAWEKPHEG